MGVRVNFLAHCLLHSKHSSLKHYYIVLWNIKTGTRGTYVLASLWCSPSGTPVLHQEYLFSFLPMLLCLPLTGELGVFVASFDVIALMFLKSI